jgi:hypothetical protein
MLAQRMTELLTLLWSKSREYASRESACTLKLLLKILVLQIVEALVIVACTRAYVKGGYAQTAIYEVAFIAQWFWQRNLGFESEARSWLKAFPVYAVGAVVGAWLGLWLTR